MLILAATGHRPNKLGGYSAEAAYRLEEKALSYIIPNKTDKMISGMALGWDQAWARVAIKLKIPLLCAIPFVGQELQWPTAAQEEYRKILEQAAEVKLVCEGGYAPYKMQVRNQWMVDHCDLLVALWDGTSGGTANCIKYANGIGRKIENLWPL